jgi:hypothetical protein
MQVTTPCIEWKKHCFWHGYGAEWDPKTKKVKYAHRLAWQRVNGPIPNGMMVLHHCDNPPCINVEHLYLGTQKDNMRDRKVRGRDPNVKGLKNPNCRFTDEQICDMRERHEAGETLTAIAKSIGSTQSYVGKVCRMVNRK